MANDEPSGAEALIGIMCTHQKARIAPCSECARQGITTCRIWSCPRCRLELDLDEDLS